MSLLVSPVKEDGCAAGCRNPAMPAPGKRVRQGGRLRVTSLACLTLEVDYRHAPEGWSEGNLGYLQERCRA
jgi:hypothetical protein